VVNLDYQTGIAGRHGQNGNAPRNNYRVRAGLSARQALPNLARKEGCPAIAPG
jgi:hypothetical protein